MREIAIVGIGVFALVVGIITYSGRATTLKLNLELQTADKSASNSK